MNIYEIKYWVLFNNYLWVIIKIVMNLYVDDWENHIEGKIIMVG